MEVVGTCLGCLPEGSCFVVNAVFAAAVLGIAIFHSSLGERSSNRRRDLLVD